MLRRLALALVLGSSLAACAQPGGGSAQAASLDEAAVRATLTQALPGMPIQRLRPSPITGYTEAVIGGRVLYVSYDGRFVIDGALIDMRERINLSDRAMQSIRAEGLKTIPAAQRIVFAPANPRHTVTVFTDIDCIYCRVFHSKIADYNALGIAVEYLFFPRAGLGSESWARADAVWCAADPLQAMTDAKAGRPVPAAPQGCETPVQAEFDLGRQIGINATPTILSADGAQHGGYLEPQRLLEALEAHAGNARQ